MRLWSIFRRGTDPITQSIDDAAARNSKQATASAEARARLAAAVEAEAVQLRRNHLGELLHDSLTIRRRHP